MTRFGKREVTAIIELLEKELDAIPRLDRVEKMKWRSRIRQQENFLMGLDDPKADKIVQKLAGRLSEVFKLYPHGVSDKLIELIKLKVSQMEARSPERTGSGGTART
jgi:MinD-like ATPase involved in chromosome partitioning or flagellar assembly